MKNFTYGYGKFLWLSFLCVSLKITVFSQQVPRGLTASNNVFIGFYEYKPVDYDLNPTTKYPVIIFLHGIGERGNGTTELSRLLGVAIPRYINSGHPMRFFWNGKWETFLVLSPQLDASYGWWPEFYVDEMINHAKQNLRVDTNRIFLTGLSLGGGGTWSFASASQGNSRKLAAIAPVCGTCSMTNGCNIATANLPVWAFHASDDGVVGAGCTVSAVENINYCKASVKPIQTLWPDGNHGIWDRAYDTVYNWQNPNLYEWFLGQNKSLAVNSLPIANAGPDLNTTTINATVTLNGLLSNDADGNIVKYTWKKISGPDYGTVSNETTAVTSVTGLSVSGLYKFELTVVDNRCGWKKDTVDLTVTTEGQPPVNQPPVANTGVDIVLTLPVNNATLTGSGSNDPDGFINSYAWSKISGPGQYNIDAPNTSTTLLNNLVQGIYNFRLLVTDNSGATDDDTIAITVNAASPPPPGNQSPIANAGNDKMLTLPENRIVLDGTASSDPDGTLVTFLWTKISGPVQYNISGANEPAATVNNLTEGTYLFRLHVTDNNGASNYDSVSVYVLAASNRLPIANAGKDTTSNLPNPVIRLNGTASHDPDGFLTAYNWTRISGPGAVTIVDSTTPTPGLTGVQTGTHLFQITVTDNNGATANDQVKVTISSAPNKKPKANAGKDTTITITSILALLNGSKSKDEDGIINSYQWKQLNGPSTAAIVNPKISITGVKDLVAGDYMFELSVSDNKGEVGKDSVRISVIVNSLSVENLFIYPNPARDNINVRCISSSIGLTTIRIYDINGTTVKTAVVNKNQSYLQQSLTVFGLKPGVYFICVKIENKKEMISKFIKQ